MVIRGRGIGRVKKESGASLVNCDEIVLRSISGKKLRFYLGILDLEHQSHQKMTMPACFFARFHGLHWGRLMELVISTESWRKRIKCPGWDWVRWINRLGHKQEIGELRRTEGEKQTYTGKTTAAFDLNDICRTISLLTEGRGPRGA
jgi:hypothetical protein